MSPLVLLLYASFANAAATTEKAGDVLYVLLPVAGFTTALIKHDREGQLQFARAIATNAVVTFGLKQVIDKRRPDGNCCDSFPSGHTSFAFMSATFLQRRYGQTYAIPAYSAATLVAYSRVAADKHFVEDVLAGAAIGFLSAHFFTTRYPGMTVTPIARHDFLGITLSMQW